MPTAIEVKIIEMPPLLTIGSGCPVTGIRPTATDIFTIAKADVKTKSYSQKPRKPFTLFTNMNSSIHQNTIKSNTAMPPTIPNSSIIMA